MRLDRGCIAFGILVVLHGAAAHAQTAKSEKLIAHAPTRAASPIPPLRSGTGLLTAPPMRAIAPVAPAVAHSSNTPAQTVGLAPYRPLYRPLSPVYNSNSLASTRAGGLPWVATHRGPVHYTLGGPATFDAKQLVRR